MISLTPRTQVQKVTLILALLTGLSLSGAARAALTDLGNGLIYDDVLDVTWLQDASLGGDHSWAGAVVWADSLVVEGADNWRLPSMSVAGGLPTGSVPLGGFVPCNVATEEECRDNELGYMFYQNLGGMAGDDLTGDQDLIQSIQSSYWSGTQIEGDPSRAYDLLFGPQAGGTTAASGVADFRAAWAVHPGMVPEPGSAALGLAALATLGALVSLQRLESRMS